MKIIKTGKEARESLKRGIDTVANCVKISLGPSGRNAIIGKKFESPEITNDGVTIAKAIILEDEIENLGADKVREVGSMTDDSVGDGTTTATVLLQAILNEGFIRLEGEFGKKKIDSIIIKNEIDESCRKVVEELKQLAIPIKTKKELEQVAFVSVENRSTAQLIASLFDKIGKDGIVRVEDGAFDVTSEVVEGMEIGAGYYSPDMANNDERELVLNNVKLLITNSEITKIGQLDGLAEKLVAQGIKELVIVSDGVSKDVQDTFVVHKLKGNMTIHAIKPTWFTLKERYDDLVARFGGTFFDKDKSLFIETADVNHLGTVSKIIATKDKTILIGGSGDTKQRVKELKSELKASLGAFDKKKLEDRIASLSGGIGIIRVGGTTETEKGYWKKKIIDAVGATKAAMDEGVVAGGGLAFKSIAEKLPKNILTESLKSPYNQIMENAGGVFEVGDDIIDPVKITRVALQNACSLAGLILTIEVASAEQNDNPTSKNN
jgi:chaperonin GroEL